MPGIPEPKSAYVFIRDPEYVWIPAIKESTTDKTAVVRIPQYASEQATICDGGATAQGWEEEEVPLKEYNRGVLPMQNVDQNGFLKSYPDMVNLPFLHEVCDFYFCREPSASSLTLLLATFMIPLH